MANSKACTKCKQIKNLQDFYFRNDKPYSACKTCHNVQVINWRNAHKTDFAIYKKQWQRDNVDKVYNYVAKYKSQNREQVKKWRTDWGLANPNKLRKYRALKKAAKYQNKIGRITAKEWRKILHKPCFYCGTKAEHVDHIVPLARGGSHTIGNLAPACSNCNLSKSTKTIMEWRIWRSRI